MNNGKLLLGILAGLAAGAAMGILFAPDKGASTRKKITSKGDEYLNELGNKFSELIDGVVKKIETVKEDALRLAETGKVKKLEEKEMKYGANAN
ncbi:MAG: YtxH domain-containing protein [Saprospiraceae bacterium]|nr:YtxH domain-containing protein [Saprospiraceae bacterium]